MTTYFPRPGQHSQLLVGYRPVQCSCADHRRPLQHTSNYCSIKQQELSNSVMVFWHHQNMCGSSLMEILFMEWLSSQMLQPLPCHLLPTDTHLKIARVPLEFELDAISVTIHWSLQRQALAFVTASSKKQNRTKSHQDHSTPEQCRQKIYFTQW